MKFCVIVWPVLLHKLYTAMNEVLVVLYHTVAVLYLLKHFLLTNEALIGVFLLCHPITVLCLLKHFLLTNEALIGVFLLCHLITVLCLLKVKSGMKSLVFCAMLPKRHVTIKCQLLILFLRCKNGILYINACGVIEAKETFQKQWHCFHKNV
jgi:hypothetical protein